MLKRIAAVMILGGAAMSQTAQLTPSSNPETRELNTVMMQSTFRIVGGNKIGTGFVVGRPIAGTNELRYVLVTAAHVFNDMKDDDVVLVTRHRDEKNRWLEQVVGITIRKNGKPLWTQHPSSDVATIYVRLPNGAIPILVPEELLAGDGELTNYEVHPGDELNVLGYPLGFSGPAGFPILRSGKIASFPLVPSKDNPYFYLDFRVFKGNSGGPVYLVSYNRYYGGGTHVGMVGMVMGLVSEEMSATEQQQSLYELRSQTYPLSIAKIVPSSLIKETIDMMPAPPSENSVPSR
jgi:S1-C subfamily serine protease